MRDHGIEYRPYQVEARDAGFNAFDDGDPSALLVLPTGTGKTVIAGMCVEHAVDDRHERALFVAHREVLITQAYKTMTAFGFDVAVEMGGQDARKHAATFGTPEVVVGSIQTLQDDRLMRWAPETFGLIIVDECHRILADSYTKMLNWFRDYNLLGITATPSRGDDRNLGARFRRKAYEYSLRRAIAEGYLVPIRTRECRISVDLRGVKIQAGDFNVGDLEERIGPKIEMLARGFADEIGGKPAVAFLPDVGSSMAFAQVLADLGVPARYVAGSGGKFGMSKAERKANLDAYNAGEYQVIVCCELLIEGWDCPRVEAVGVLRPTQQQYRYTQMVGRGTRPSPKTGKTELLVVDFDWQTDKESKDLCATVDLFDDGSLDEEVFAVAREILSQAKPDESTDPLKVIEEAERIVRTRTRFMVRLSGRRPEYERVNYDPIGVSKILDVALNRKYDLDPRGRNPATKNQVGYLRSLGMEAPEGLSTWGASKMLSKIEKRRKDGLADIRQVRELLALGVNEGLARTMDMVDATIAIGQLRQDTRENQQRRLFE